MQSKKKVTSGITAEETISKVERTLLLGKYKLPSKLILVIFV